VIKNITFTNGDKTKQRFNCLQKINFDYKIMNIPQSNLLLVDDKSENLFVLQELLADEEGYSFYQSTSASKALEIAYSQPIDLVLLDIQMPEMNGYEVAALLKSNNRTKHIPVVFVTGINKGQQQVLQGYTIGCIDYLFKPLDPSLTRAKIKSILQVHHLQKQLELKTSELKNSHEKLLKSNEELNHFVYSASHDLRAPLLSLLGLIQVLELENGENLYDRLAMMKETILKLDVFVRDVINYSYNNHMLPQHEEINFTKVIEESLEYVQYLPLSKKIKKATTLSLPNSFISDSKRLKVIFNNLIANAIKYHHPDQPNPFVNIDVRTSEEGCTIRIADNGIGIRSEHQDKVFNMFYTATAQSPGPGLGLYVVKEVIDKLGGSLTLQSQYGVGTTVTITLPTMKDKRLDHGNLSFSDANIYRLQDFSSQANK
jgi:two-component system sensor histidine kinase/response regulator